MAARNIRILRRPENDINDRGTPGVSVQEEVIRVVRQNDDDIDDLVTLRRRRAPLLVGEVKNTIQQNTNPTVRNNDQLRNELNRIRENRGNTFEREQRQFRSIMNANMAQLDAIRNNRNLDSDDEEAIDLGREEIQNAHDDAVAQSEAMYKSYFQCLKEFIERHCVETAIASLIIGIVGSIFLSPAIAIPVAIVGLSASAYYVNGKPPETVPSPCIQRESRAASPEPVIIS